MHDEDRSHRPQAPSHQATATAFGFPSHIDVHVHVKNDTGGSQQPMLEQILAGIQQLLTGQETIMATQQDAAAQVAATGVVLDKVSAETTALIAQIAELKVAVEAAGNVTPELQAALDGVASKAAAIDAQVDDVAPNPTPTPEPTPEPAVGRRPRP